VVFYAGDADWKRWYGGGRSEWIGGYATMIGYRWRGIVVNAAGPRTRVEDLLRHEMTHAASMPDTPTIDPSMWWLVEGLAEVAANGGSAVGRYDGLPEVRHAVRDKRWNGPLGALHTQDRATQADVTAAYGVGFLAVRHLAERFGEADLLAFFAAVVVARTPIDRASLRVFGMPWNVLEDQCVAAVRAAVSPAG
jgi:hypothetical protein